ncbi:MAG TPA: hypothetical protein VFS70_23175, partial [Actinomycetota bacterium]|nr:hypothetical protein [Actinomycetota bacterium]
MAPVAAAVLPHPPLLVAELAGAAAAELGPLRDACRQALTEVTEAADLTVVVGDGQGQGKVGEAGGGWQAGQVEGDQGGEGDLDAGAVGAERPGGEGLGNAPDRAVADDDGELGGFRDRGHGLAAGGAQRVELGRGGAGQLGGEQGRMRQDGGRDRRQGRPGQPTSGNRTAPAGSGRGAGA